MEKIIIEGETSKSYVEKKNGEKTYLAEIKIKKVNLETLTHSNSYITIVENPYSNAYIVSADSYSKQTKDYYKQKVETLPGINFVENYTNYEDALTSQYAPFFQIAQRLVEDLKKTYEF